MWPTSDRMCLSKWRETQQMNLFLFSVSHLSVSVPLILSRSICRTLRKYHLKLTGMASLETKSPDPLIYGLQFLEF